MKKGYCWFCGRHKFLELGPNDQLVCGYCAEDENYINLVARNARVERREARMVRKGHRALSMAYEAD